MKICPTCETQNEDFARFCDECGTPLTDADVTPSNQTSVPAQALQTPQTPISQQEAPTGATTPTVSMPPTAKMPLAADSGAAPANVTPAIIAIIATIIALAVCVTSFVTYRMELWGGRTVPTIEAADANDAIKQLEQRGFTVKKRQQYSSKAKGSFLELEGAAAGERIDTDTPLTIVESLGPGVPKGTVGMSEDDGIDNVSGMGVPVNVSEVVSDNPGNVVVTTPADGQPVTDLEEGIHLGVGVSGHGVPVEIAGMDKDAASQRLAASGWAVTLEPRFSDRDHLGKIVGADPGIGVQTDSDSVVLYYGVAADQTKDVLTETEDIGGGQTVHAATNQTALAGKWCTDAGDCITLSAQGQFGKDLIFEDDSDGASGDKAGNASSDASDSESSDNDLDYEVPLYMGANTLHLCNFSHDISGCTPEAMSDVYESPMRNHLLTGSTGAAELYVGMGLPNCGAETYVGGVGSYCHNGKIENAIDENGNLGPVPPSDSLTYDAEEFMLVMPVDADLDMLINDGYFADAKNISAEDRPDADRPYLLRRASRDSIPQVDVFATNPFVPTKDSKPIPFDTAPTAENAYYLVYDPVDWSQLSSRQVTDELCAEGR